MDRGREGNNQGEFMPARLGLRRDGLPHVCPKDATRASRPLAVIYFAVVARIQSETSFNAAGLNVSSILLYSVGDPVWHVWNR